MNIERIDLYHISQWLVSPFVTSFGPQQQRDCLLVAIPVSYTHLDVYKRQTCGRPAISAT